MFNRTTALIGIFLAHTVSTLAQLPAGFEDTAHITGVTNPIAMAYAPDGRLFIAERDGTILIFKDGLLLPSAFAQLNPTLNSERGLLGIAIDPAFGSSPYVYVYYTTSANSINPPPTPKNRVSRLTANGDVMTPGSETILVDNIPSDAGNHNAGCIRFGLDDRLYIATGDGGATAANSQNLGNLAGKILRINRDGTIPGDNPFVGTAGARTEIWCYGLRNPFRFSFRPGTNVPYIADVGQNTWEEVNVGQPGGNYGWPTTEGITNDPRFISPIHVIGHGGNGASITGGCFITNATWPAAYQGSYYYGDYIDQYVARLVVTPANTLSQALAFGPAARPVDFIQGLDGDLYYANLNGNAIQRLWYSGKTNGYVIATSKSSAPAGTTISVNWTAPAGSSTTDWIALFKIGEPNSAYTRWFRFTDGLSNGFAAVPLPQEQGIYEIRYLLNNGFVVAGRSPHIRVTPPLTGFTLTPGQTSVTVAAPLSISWTAPASQSAIDWIGLFRVGDSNREPLWWRYTNAAVAGTFDLKAPGIPGQYEFRYLLENGYTDVARSAAVTVNPATGYSLSAAPSSVIPGGSVTVNWTAPAGSSTFDWIGLFRVGDSHRETLGWTYTGGATSGSHVFKMPAQTGTYEFRYLLHDGYTELRATSNPVTVQ